MVARRLASVAVDVAFDSAPDISFPVREMAGCSVVVAAGEIDIWTCPALRKALDAAADSARRLVIDLTEVTFLDSSGLGVLLDARMQGSTTWTRGAGRCRRHGAPCLADQRRQRRVSLLRIGR